MYGERDDPYAVLARLGRRLEETLAPDAVLPTIVATVTESLKLPYAAIALRTPHGTIVDSPAAPASTVDEFRVVAASGSPSGESLHLPLVYQGETVGELILGSRIGETFSATDQRLLEDLARQAGVAAHAVRLTTDLQRLTADLQRSRERLVTTREEERRRMRRDLHDGLGPTLASLTFKLEAARNLLRYDVDRADVLLKAMTDQTQTAIGDIRRLVYDLRPPALDELGLISALREHVAQLQPHGVHIAVDAPELLPSLPAAVEVAAYRIAQEALTNVVRHAGAHTCVLRLRVDPVMLCLEIEDDGQGLLSASAGPRTPGVGLHSMHERATELGGTFVIRPGSAGGTVVEAKLPLA